jgi:hypothetical protein
MNQSELGVVVVGSADRGRNPERLDLSSEAGPNARASGAATVDLSASDEVARFLNRTVETAVFLRDVYELGEGGDPAAIEMLLPWRAEVRPLQAAVVAQMASATSAPLAQAVAAIVRACPLDLLPDADVDGLIARAQDICQLEERPLRKILRPERHVNHARAVWRLARYLRLVFLGYADKETDAVEWFVQRAWIPTGRAYDLEPAKTWHEHVVPRCAIVVEAERRFLLDPDWSVEAMTQWLLRYLAIVVISRSDAEELDGPRCLKWKMPDDWHWDSDDCIYQRLHLVHTRFTPPEGMPCRCVGARGVPTQREAVLWPTGDRVRHM